MNIADKYRPTTLDRVIGQPKAVAYIRKAQTEPTGLAGRAWWIDGPTGIGKTTIARIIASEVADDFNAREIAPDDLTANALREIEDRFGLYALGDKNGFAYIVNEAHGLRQAAVQRLKLTLEAIPKNVVFIFTTTRLESAKLFDDDRNEDSRPLLARCEHLRLTNQGILKPAAEYIRGIFQQEGVDGQPIEWYERLVKEAGSSIREAMLTGYQRMITKEA